jgi:hypothetical protein
LPYNEAFYGKAGWLTSSLENGWTELERDWLGVFIVKGWPRLRAPMHGLNFLSMTKEGGLDFLINLPRAGAVGEQGSRET